MFGRLIDLRALGPIAALAFVLAACSAGATVMTTTIPSVTPMAGESSVPTIAPTSPATPSASAALIPDGSYANTPMDVAAVNAMINADTKLTAAEKTDIIQNAFELGTHKTFTVTLEFQHGQYTEHQGLDGAVGEVGSRATFAFPDDHTLVIEESCCGISTFDVALAQDGFSLKVRGGAQAATEEDRLIGHILFESSPFTRVH